MISRSSVSVLVALCALTGCGGPATAVDTGLKRGVAQTTPDGWVKPTLEGISYSFCTPKDIKTQVAPPELLASAKQGAPGSEVLKNIVIGTSTKVPPNMVIVFEEAEIKTTGQIDAFMVGFKGSLTSQGILTKDKMKESVQQTPIGEARVVTSPGTVGGQKADTAIYVWADKTVVYTMMVSGVGTNPDATAKQIADTFRVK